MDPWRRCEARSGALAPVRTDFRPAAIHQDRGPPEVTTHSRVTGQGPPILLINGLTRTMDAWEPFIDALPGRTLISFDAPGIGLSPRPKHPLSIRELADIAASVIPENGFQSADILGFSHGGAVAQELAHRAPLRVRRLVLAGTSCGIGSSLGGDPTALRKLHTKETDKSAALWRSLAFMGWTSVNFLGQLQMPTLVVCGKDDQVVNPSNSRVLAGRIPDAELSVLDADHDLQAEGSAQLLARAVDRFLKQHPGRYLGGMAA